MLDLLFKFFWRTVTQRRVQALTIVVVLDKLLDMGAQIF